MKQDDTTPQVPEEDSFVTKITAEADLPPEPPMADPAFTPRDLRPLENATAAEDVEPSRRSWLERFRRKPKDAAPQIDGESSPGTSVSQDAGVLKTEESEPPVAVPESVVSPATDAAPAGLTGVLDVLRERSAAMRDAEPETLAAEEPTAEPGHEGVSGEPTVGPGDESVPAELTTEPGEQPLAVEETVTESVWEPLPAEEPAPEPALEAAPDTAPEPESIFAWLAGPEDELEPSDGASVGDEPLFGGSLAELASAPGVVSDSGVAAPVDLTGTQPTTVMTPVAAAPLEVDLGPDQKKKWWVWAAVAVAVLLVGGGIGYGWWWLTQRPIVVPDIVGKKPAEATQKLNDLGLKLGKVSEVPTDAAPAGTIVIQKPKSNTTLKPGSAVAFVVAAAPEQAKTPNVVGISVDDASAALAEARLRPLLVESYNATVAAGFVISQTPSMGVEVPPGSQVALAVSKGLAPASATVPHALGLPESDGTTLLEARGLTVRVFRSRDASVPAGQIVAQTPLPGSSSTPGSVAMILVSTGPTPGSTSVPDVVGSSKKKAESRLKSAGMTAEVISVPNATVAKGNVIAQMPSSGRRVGSGTVVGLLVSTGADQPLSVPSIVGTLSADASKTVTASGFKAVSLSLPFAGVAQGRVWAQYPLPGTSYTRGYPVIFLIAEPLK